MFERFFQFEKYKTNLKIEIVAGFTTFMSMAYILLINPLLLSESGMPLQADAPGLSLLPVRYFFLFPWFLRPLYSLFRALPQPLALFWWEHL